MKLKIINSGSVGNAYILENEHEALLIECGVPFIDIKKALDFKLNKLVGCLLTHEHMDHAKSVLDVFNTGNPIYSSQKTFKKLNIGTALRTYFADDFPEYMGNFTIQSFKVNHDAVDPIGFYIHHPDCGNVLFATDTFYLKYTFPNLNNIIIEANYCEDILEQREKQGNANHYISERVKRSHMSIQQCIKTLQATDLSNVNNIVLIHLSDGNSHKFEFKQKAEQATGKTVHVASKGMEINFGKTPF